MYHLLRARRVPAPEYQVSQETRAVPPSNQARRLVPARRQTSIIRRFSRRTRQTSKACQETRAARLLSSRLASNRGRSSRIETALGISGLSSSGAVFFNQARATAAIQEQSS